MIYRLIISALALVFATANTFADSMTGPVLVNIALEKAYVPRGFDTNDRIQVAVQGTLMNSCYKVGPHSFKLDKALKTIEVQQQAYVYLGFCLMMVIPFSEVIDVGILDEAGTYSVVDASSKKELSKFSVVQASGIAQDDFLYAPVSDAYISSADPQHKNTLVVVGSFTDKCSVFQEMRVQEYEDTIVVQPIMRRLSPDSDCGSEKTRFLKTYTLSDSLKGTYLLHVRSLNGSAINRMLDLE